MSAPPPAGAPVFGRRPGSVALLAEVDVAAEPGMLPPLFRVRVDDAGHEHDEVWAWRAGTWVPTAALVPHRAGRATTELEELTAQDARLLAAALAARGGGPHADPAPG